MGTVTPSITPALPLWTRLRTRAVLNQVVICIALRSNLRGSRWIADGVHSGVAAEIHSTGAEAVHKEIHAAIPVTNAMQITRHSLRRSTAQSQKSSGFYR